MSLLDEVCDCVGCSLAASSRVVGADMSLLDEVFESALDIVRGGGLAPTVLELHPSQLGRLMRMTGCDGTEVWLTPIGRLRVVIDPKVSEHSFMLR